jgi:hypothetical protein
MKTPSCFASLLSFVGALLLTACCTEAHFDDPRNELLTDPRSAAITPVGAVQLFWDSCFFLDSKEVERRMVTNAHWDAQRAIRFITGGKSSHNISDHSRTVFVVTRINWYTEDKVTVTGDVVEKSGDWDLVDWELLLKSFEFDVVWVGDRWRVDLSRYSPPK